VALVVWALGCWWAEKHVCLWLRQNPWVLDVLTAAAAERLQGLGPMELRRLVIGFRAMEYQPGPAWLAAHHRAVMVQLGDFRCGTLGEVLEGYKGLGFEADPRVQARFRQLEWQEQQEMRRREMERHRREEMHAQKERRMERERVAKEELSHMRQQEQLDRRLRLEREQRLRVAEEHQEQHRQMQVQQQQQERGRRLEQEHDLSG